MTACLFANTFENLDETDTFLGEKKNYKKVTTEKKERLNRPIFIELKERSVIPNERY